MTQMGCQNVVEMNWWDEEKLPGKEEILVACTPSQHFCNRSLSDMNKVRKNMLIMKLQAQSETFVINHQMLFFTSISNQQ